MPRPAGNRSELVYIPVKFPRDVADTILDIARNDPTLWYDHGRSIGLQPNTSAAVRQLVDEALAARTQEENPP